MRDGCVEEHYRNGCVMEITQRLKTETGCYQHKITVNGKGEGNEATFAFSLKLSKDRRGEQKMEQINGVLGGASWRKPYLVVKGTSGKEYRMNTRDLCHILAGKTILKTRKARIYEHIMEVG